MWGGVGRWGEMSLDEEHDAGEVMGRMTMSLRMAYLRHFKAF